MKQYKAIVSWKKKSLEKEYNSKNKLNAKNLDSDKVELRVNISQEEIATLENEWYKRRLLVEEDIKQWQMWKHSNRAPFPNQSWEQINSWNVAEEKYWNMETKINIALKDAAFLTCFNNDKELANEILRWIANNELSAENLTFCQMHYVDMLPYFEKYGLKNQAYQAVSTGWWQYTSSTEYYWNVDLTTAYKTWWVKWWTNSLLSKAFPNASSDQISNFSNLALAWLWIFAVYKVWKRFFGKNDKWERNILWKAWLLAAWYFVPQLLTWKDGYSMLWDILSWKQDFKELWYKLSNCLWFLDGSDKETSTAITPWILWMTIFTQNDKVSDIRNLQNEWWQCFYDLWRRCYWRCKQ